MSYTDSHAVEGYGDRYSKTYSVGYYFHQWEKVEKPLLVSELKKLRAAGKSTYLDFACGTGRILAVGEQIFETSYGVDVAETMLEHARRNCHKSTILRRDITTNPLEQKFDVVTAFRFFLNAEPELRFAVLKALHEHLLEDGVLIANIHTNSISPLGLAYRIRNKLTDLYTPTLSHFKPLRPNGENHKVETMGYKIHGPGSGPIKGVDASGIFAKKQHAFLSCQHQVVLARKKSW